MDWASLAGLVLAITAVVFGQALEGGHFRSLVQPAAFAIVVVGTLGAVLLQSGSSSFRRGLKMIAWVFYPPPSPRSITAEEVYHWTLTARREGLLSLERHADGVQDAFVSRGIRLIVDGVHPSRVREILEAEISSYERREREAIRIWEVAGGYAPTIGILGAVLGLIHVMENLSDPSKLGSGIAVAFVATIYGVGFANLIFLPIAGKLKGIISEAVLQRELMVDVLCAIANGENARTVVERMTACA